MSSWDKILRMLKIKKRLISRVYEEFLQINKKKTGILIKDKGCKQAIYKIGTQRLASI